MSEAGVAVFAHNRPKHLKYVLSSLQDNAVGHIYFFIDGAKNKKDKKKVRAVQDIVDNVDWCDKTVQAREKNVGLAQSITSGVDRVFKDHDQIIVLEDDCVPASNFVSYMEACLERYESSEMVMNVTGYSPPIDIPDDYPYDVYFTYRSSSWGWGTWKSAWEHFEQDPMSLDELEDNADKIKDITEKAGSDLYPMMRNQLNGEIDSWAVWWSYAIANNDGVCINPVNSKVKNIGHDATGTHSGESDRFAVDIDDTPIEELAFPDHVYVDANINSKYNNFIGGETSWPKKMARITLKKLKLLRVYRSIFS